MFGLGLVNEFEVDISLRTTNVNLIGDTKGNVMQPTMSL